jgi:Icc-related predicted phosphoesterase
MRNKWLDLVVLSDNHTYFDFLEVPAGDILIHCGDFSYRGNSDEVYAFIDWIKKQPHKHKLWIPGNHELSLEDFPYNIETIDAESGAVCIHNKEHIIDGIKFFGSAYTPKYGTWAFMNTEEQAKRYWENAPLDVDVLVTHGPPKGVLDMTISGDHAGSQALFDYVKKVNPHYHFFGHIHEAYGVDIYTSCKTVFINACVLDEKYKPLHQPIKLPIQAVSKN